MFVKGLLAALRGRDGGDAGSEPAIWQRLLRVIGLAGGP